jgi:predicted RNA-binding Zn ribbon-like protein
MANEFQLVAGHVALDFTNTLDFRYAPDRTTDFLNSYERFLAFCRQSGMISVADIKSLLTTTSESEARRILRKAIEFREALYLLILSTVRHRRPHAGSLQSFNSFLAAVRTPRRVNWQRAGFVRCDYGIAKSPMGPLWLIIDASAALLTSSDLYHIRECREETCRWLFLDQSKNQSRRWCDMRLCGNRAKAQRFYARVRSDT